MSGRVLALCWHLVSWPLLIVEDDVDVREELAEIFNARGFRSMIATDGADAFALASGRGQRPAVIVLDLVMPRMDGAAFLAHQHESPVLDGVPVIILTAQRDRLDRPTSTVRAVLEKPFQLPTLLRLVQDIVHESPRS